MAILLKNGDLLKAEAQKTADRLKDEGYVMEYDAGGNYALYNRKNGNKYTGELVTGIQPGKGGFLAKGKKAGLAAQKVFEQRYSEGWWGPTRAQQKELDAGTAAEADAKESAKKEASLRQAELDMAWRAKGQREEEDDALNASIKADQDAGHIAATSAARAQDEARRKAEDEAEARGEFYTERGKESAFYESLDKSMEDDADAYSDSYEAQYPIPKLYDIGEDGKAKLNPRGVQYKEQAQKNKLRTTSDEDLRKRNAEIADFEYVKSWGETFFGGIIPSGGLIEEESPLGFLNKYAGLASLIPNYFATQGKYAYNFPGRYRMSWAELMNSSPEQREHGASEYERKLKIWNQVQAEEAAKKGGVK